MSFPQNRAKYVGTFGIYAEATEKSDEKYEGNSKTALAATRMIMANPKASASAPEPTATEIKLAYIHNGSDMKAQVNVTRENSDGTLVDGEETIIPPGIKTCVGRGDGKDLVTIKLINKHWRCADYVATKQKPLIPGMLLSVRFSGFDNSAYVV